jgi:hypothetical protein
LISTILGVRFFCCVALIGVGAMTFRLVTVLSTLPCQHDSGKRCD